jgi:hypothetical protein
MFHGVRVVRSTDPLKSATAWFGNVSTEWGISLAARTIVGEMNSLSVDSLVVEGDIEGLGHFSDSILLLGQVREIWAGKVDLNVCMGLSTSSLGGGLNDILNLVVWNINVQ